MSTEYFRVKLASIAKEQLRKIGKKYGKKTYETIRDLIRDLEFGSLEKGEPLGGRLKGLFSRHYSRFRIIYRVDRDEFEVIVIGCGWHESESRKDIYSVIERLVESGEIQLRQEDSSEDDEA